MKAMNTKVNRDPMGLHGLGKPGFSALASKEVACDQRVRNIRWGTRKTDIQVLHFLFY